MNRDPQWRPKVGEKVSVTGYAANGGCMKLCEGEVATVYALPADFVVGIQFDHPMTLWNTHLRNLDPILGDERKGAQRPPIQHADEVMVTLSGVVDGGKVWRASIESFCTLRTDDPRVRQIERRKQDLGREARKS